MENNIVLYGASGHCKVIIDILQANNQQISFIVDDDPKIEKIFDLKVYKLSDFNFVKKQEMIITIGNNKIRKKLSKLLNVNFVQAIHPKAIISKHTSLGKGTVVMAGAVINSDVIIGNHCIINSGAIIEHDCVISDYAHIAPNTALAGNVLVKEGAQVGIGASVIQGLTIGKWSVIGAGSVIIRDVPDFAKVVGNPGQILNYNNDL